MKIKFIFILIFIAEYSFSQEVNLDNFVKKHQLKVNSDIAFKSLKNQSNELDLSFESQQWPVEILKYVIKELRENTFISSKITVQFIIEHPNKSKVGFRENYVEFLSDTYEFIMERL